jgi:hypothetical protein
MSARSQGQGNKGTKILIVVFAVVVVLLIGAVVVLANNVKKVKEEAAKTAEEEQKRQTVVTEENAEGFVEELFDNDDSSQRAAPSSFDTVMTTVWHFTDGQSESSDAYVENAIENATPIYFDVRLTDTQETIYESPVLPLGTHVNKIKLMRDLDPGIYDCELTYHLIDDEQNTLGTIDVVVTVIVEN